MSYQIDFLGGRKNFPSSVLFVQTNTVTVANTVAETTLSGTGVGSLVLPANFFIVGRTLRLCGMGFHSSAANPNFTFKVKLGSTIILNTGAFSSGADTNTVIDFDAVITCRTTGASGTLFSQGWYQELGASPDEHQMVNTAAVTIDTTASQTLSLTAQWGTASASNTISLTNFTFEVLY